MSRRDRETAQEEQESTEQQVGTPQNKAKAKAGTRRAKSASSKDSAVVATSAADAENNNNHPLKKVVFVHHVLRFLKQGYLDSDDIEESSIAEKKLIPIPRFLHLRHVSSCWKETVEFYNPQPQENALTFCRHLFKWARDENFNSPSVLGSIVLRDIVGWLSNVEMTNISDNSSSFVYDILYYFTRCVLIIDSAWKVQPGFEHHVAFVRDTLLWLAEFCVFKEHSCGDDLGEWCDIISCAITRKKGEYFGFDTPEMKDVVLSVSKNVTTSNGGDRIRAVTKWFDLVYDLTHNNEKMQKIFGTKEVYDGFLRLSDVMTKFLSEDYYEYYCQEMEEYCDSIFSSLSAITELKKNVNLFATVELRDRMMRIFRWINTQCDCCPDSKYFSRLVHNLISTNKSNKKLFAVESVRDVMLRNYEEDEYFAGRDRYSYFVFDFRHRRWTEHIQDNEGACLLFENLVALFEVNPKLFLVDETRKCFVEFARRIGENFHFGYRKTASSSVSSATIRGYLTALHTMMLHNEKLFFSERIDKFLIRIKRRRKTLLKGTATLFSKIESIYAKMKKHLKTEEKEKAEDEEEENRCFEEEWGEKMQKEKPFFRYCFCSCCQTYHFMGDELQDEYWQSKYLVYWKCYYREREEERDFY